MRRLRVEPPGLVLLESQVIKKRELKNKSFDWIIARVNQLDPKGYLEEIHSFWHFGQKSKSFTLEIIAIADWGQRYIDIRFHYPLPAFPHYLFNEFAGSHQGRGQVPTSAYKAQLPAPVWRGCKE